MIQMSRLTVKQEGRELKFYIKGACMTLNGKAMLGIGTKIDVGQIKSIRQLARKVMHAAIELDRIAHEDIVE